MESNRRKILIIVGLFTLLISGLAVSFPSDETNIEQVSIQEEEIEVICTQEISPLTYVRVIHDSKRNVTCWFYQGGGTCIPDHMLSP